MFAQMKTLRTSLLGVLCFIVGSAYAQDGTPDYVNQMADPSVNFYTVQESFEAYWKDREVERSHGWKQFKRWEAFMEPRVFPTGERPDPAILWNEGVTMASNKMNLGNWSHIGPYNGNTLEGIGRVNCIEFHPENSNIIFVGAPAGGVWKSTDGGSSWSTNTDLLPNLGVSDIAIDPHHPDTMYIATGDRDAADTYSIGLLKSTNGGQTWNTTGLSYSVNMSRRIGGIYINPKNTQEIVVATRSGIHRSTDGGANFSSVQGGSWQMLTFIPGATDTLFVGSNSGGNIMRSTDAGQTWTTATTGIPNSGVTRVEIATTADDDDYVYALVSASNNGLDGVYRSTDRGANWSLVFSGNTQNLLAWGTNPGGNSGGSAGGQGWYDLAIAVSPIDKNEIYVGGVNIWRSTNGGSSWSLSAHWYGGGGADFAHADQHAFMFKPGTSDFYAGNDGGVYMTADGTNYVELCDGLHITQYYCIDISEGELEVTIGGAQDNGTHLNNSFGWDRVKGGDGMDNAIAESNPNVMYAASQYGNFSKSTNGGQSFNATFNLPPNGTGQWVTPIVIDPTNDNVVYIGYDQLWKTTNAGLSFSATSGTIQGTQQWIDAIAVAESNPDYIYVSIEQNVYKSMDGGATWNLISNNISNSRSVTDITVSDTDPNHVWICKSGYDANFKVYESINGGLSWSNITGSLPNLPVNAIIYQKGSNGAVYVGTDIGVYYRDYGSNSWVPFMSGLPNVIVNDLEIHYGAGIIRAGTYGRGVWESPLANTFLDKPEAAFKVNPKASCVAGDTVVLTDISAYSPTAWNWTIVPSTFSFVNGTNAMSQNPEIVVSATGQYSVQLIASNRFGSDTLVEIGAIGVGGLSVPYSEDFANGISEDYEIVNPDNNVTWSGSPAGNGSVYMDFYDYSTVGAEDDLILPPFDLTGVANTTLVYDMAYRQYSSSALDSLKIYVSSDCGATWTLEHARGEDGSGNFVTGAMQTSEFTPQSASDWRTDSLDLSAYDNLSQVRIKFVGVNGYGNNLYLDNIAVIASAGAAPTADYFAADTACEGSTVQYYNLSGVNGQNYQWTFPGGSPSTSTAANPIVTYSNNGTYAASLVVSNGFGSDSIYVANSIHIVAATVPTVNITASTSTVCAGEEVTFYASSVNGGANPQYQWFVNGLARGNTGDTVTIQQLSHNDTIRVELQSTEQCATPSVVASNNIILTVNPLPTVDAGTYGTVCSGDAAFTLTGTPAGGTYSGRGVSGTTFDPVTAGVGAHTITYDYTDANGCFNSATTVITVQNGPNVFLTVKDYCDSDPAENMNYGFPSGGTYSIDGVVSTVFDPANLGAGKYYVEYSYSNGNCTTVKADTVEVFAAPPANPGITVDWGSLTCNLVGYDYQWLDANGTAIPGETNRVFYPQVAGSYAVRVSAGATCSETSNYVFIEKISVEEQMLAQIDLKLFPNPTADQATLSFNLEEAAEVKVELMDLSGKILEVRNEGTQVGNVSVPFSLRKYAAGVYMIKLTVGDVSTTKRIVLE